MLFETCPCLYFWRLPTDEVLVAYGCTFRIYGDVHRVAIDLYLQFCWDLAVHRCSSVITSCHLRTKGKDNAYTDIYLFASSFSLTLSFHDLGDLSDGNRLQIWPIHVTRRMMPHTCMAQNCSKHGDIQKNKARPERAYRMRDPSVYALPIEFRVLNEAGVGQRGIRYLSLLSLLILSTRIPFLCGSKSVTYSGNINCRVHPV